MAAMLRRGFGDSVTSGSVAGTWWHPMEWDIEFLDWVLCGLYRCRWRADMVRRSPEPGNHMNALAFARDYLRKNPKASFAEIRDAAKKKKLTLFPISYGRAQALEGLVKSRPYGSGKKAKKKSTRGPGRPKGSKNRPKIGSRGATLDSVNELLESVKAIQQERDDAVRTLEKIRALLD
jgi:hypothetical protein